MSPVSQSDGHDGPGLIDELVPGFATMSDDVIVGLEDSVGQPIIADELPDVFDRVEFGRFGWQRHEGDVVGNVELRREVPAGLIEQQDGVGARRDGSGDFGQVQAHRVRVAEWQDETGARSLGRADRAENVGRARPLIMRRRRPGSAPGPSPGDLVLLADPRLVLKPDFYGLARRVLLDDFLQRGGEVFLNASTASSFWA